MGVLDSIFASSTDDPRYAANMALFASMMQGDTPGGLFQHAQMLAGAKDKQRKAKMEEVQLQRGLFELNKAKRDEDTEVQIGEAAKAAYRSPETARAMSMGPTEDGGNVPSIGPGFDTKGFLGRMWSIKPMQALAMEQSMGKETAFGKIDPDKFTPESLKAFMQTGGKDYSLLQPRSKVEVGPGGQAFDPYRTPAGTVLSDPNKPFTMGPQGLVPNLPYQQYETNKARAGATNVSVNTEKNLLGGLAEGFAKSITGAKEGAQAALSTINTVNRLNDALDSGKVLAGPGTTFRQYGLQLGSMLGVGGKDGQEKLLNTRQAVQSLAQLELDAAQQMKGQGQITEAERAIIKRAAAGDVDGMTTGELRLLGGVLDRSARFKIRGYNAQVQPLKSMPNASAIQPFLEVAEPEQRQGAGGVRRFNPQTGRIE